MLDGPLGIEQCQSGSVFWNQFPQGAVTKLALFYQISNKCLKYQSDKNQSDQKLSDQNLSDQKQSYQNKIDQNYSDQN